MPFFTILTLFPEALEPYLGASIVGSARERGLARIELVDFRDFARDRHRTVDDRPFGGGPGMVLRPEPIVECVEWLERRHGEFRKIMLCPTGRTFTQDTAESLASEERILLLCGRYEGFDQRIAELFDWETISLGEFVLSGGEIGALAVTEAVVRLLDGALGNERSALEDSFGTARAPDEAGEAPLCDHPHYTRPRSYRGHAVPEVLLGGDHAAIARWRRERARERDAHRREDREE
ncbi:MAG: tRNA (guanosine(37)-N1)-methyltransferase TrmD [Planctomycetota bacterium]|nr:tRNA (guanosine(37)-N1)-methyltransferase TrmD [Planctomycetota bacterium]MDP6762177.1 tRNA (guanosine(37)-N1)-methyltransferase TrmD [Planctomycetota bacterium]MDP6990065.1 tRNA (guanosine(37)-N1)-methyltransferase TrmD [Planctomycetota bacterium]